MKSVDLVTVRLTFSEGHPRAAPHHLRGAIAAHFPDEPLFHQHAEEGLVYRMPRIQYRWDEVGAMLIGLEEGARKLVEVPWPGMELRLGNDRVTVAYAECSFRRFEVRAVDHLLRYRLAAPWLPFSQENYARYKAMSQASQAGERDRLARAGILIGLRGMGVEVGERLFVAVEEVRPARCLYKGVELLGFQGRVLVNLELPPGFAFGRSVSHGYGWLMPEMDGGGGKE
jgi:Cas6b C-terminal domain/Cas6b N-terminal domain